MPYHVGEKGSYGCSGYPALKDDGTVMGCHTTREEAAAQIYAINQSEGNVEEKEIVTSGGGGAIVSNDLELATKAKYLTTTAKVPHPYEYVHDELGYNFRMPNINAALICAQLEQLDFFLKKRKIFGV